MTRCVVDVSVALKWYLPEANCENALSLLESLQSADLTIHVPDLFFAEAGNILWKKVRKGELQRREASEITRALRSVPQTVHPSELLFTAALTLACSLDRTVYDSLYLALAALLDCPLVTADLRLCRALEQQGWGGSLRWVGELGN